MKNLNNIAIPRRTALKGLGVFTAFGLVTACGGGSMESTTSSVPTTDTNTGGSTNTGGGTTTGSADSPIELVTDWATNGTSSMTENFPDDSLFEFGTACAVSLTGNQTEGPCYFMADNRDDISEEQTGLPMMLCLQLVNQNCEPLSGYEIEVWHCNVTGLYSGDTSGSGDSSRFNSGFCTGSDSAALASKWFRGTLVTDSAGRVNFKSCFPGWYPSRAIHIHFRVRNNNNDQVISQFGFDDTFNEYICTTHSNYTGNGAPDTSNTTDTVFGSDYQDYLFNIQQNNDGSLLAFKRIVIS